MTVGISRTPHTSCDELSCQPLRRSRSSLFKTREKDIHFVALLKVKNISMKEKKCFFLKSFKCSAGLLSNLSAQVQPRAEEERRVRWGRRGAITWQISSVPTTLQHIERQMRSTKKKKNGGEEEGGKKESGGGGGGRQKKKKKKRKEGKGREREEKETGGGEVVSQKQKKKKKKKKR